MGRKRIFIDNITGLAVTISGSLPAGTNNIGDVDIASALPAGTNFIGHVGLYGSVTFAALVVTIAATNTAQQLPAQAIPYGREVVIRRLTTSANAIYISNSAANVADPAYRYPLEIPGEAAPGIAVTDLSAIWIYGTINEQIKVCVEV